MDNRRDFLKSLPIWMLAGMMPNLTRNDSWNFTVGPLMAKLEETIYQGYSHLTPYTVGDQEYLHIGQDFNIGHGEDDYRTFCRAIAKGEVLFVRDGRERPLYYPDKEPSSLGKTVMLLFEFPDGTEYISRYCHLSEPMVREGQRFPVGHLIGRIGKTGLENGITHLHVDLANFNVIEHYKHDLWWVPGNMSKNFINHFYVDPLARIKRFLNPQYDGLYKSYWD